MPKLSGEWKIGVIGSLGVRRDEESFSALAALLGDADDGVVRAAALALGHLGTRQAAQALAQAQSSGLETKWAITDASLAVAESLLADGKKSDALAIYKRFAGTGQPKYVRLAATRGMLACASNKP